MCYICVMKRSIQNKIEQIQSLAKSQHLSSAGSSVRSTSVNDSLAEAIRNEKDATLFMAELDAVIKIAASK